MKRTIEWMGGAKLDDWEDRIRCRDGGLHLGKGKDEIRLHRMNRNRNWMMRKSRG